MNATENPETAENRLAALQRYGILDTPPEHDFDQFVHLAACLCACRGAGLLFLDRDREWFKARLEVPWESLPGPAGLMRSAALSSETRVVASMKTDPALKTCPLAGPEAGYDFAAWAPLVSPQGVILGALAVLHPENPNLSRGQLDALEGLAQQAVVRLELQLREIELERERREHTATEEALRAAEKKFREIFENVVEGIFQSTPDGRYIAANRMLARIYGYPDVGTLMESISDISHQLYVEAGRREEFQRLLQENDEISDFESRIFQRGGEVIWISENARAVRDADGRLLYYEGTVQDITRRKAAEQALQESEILYHSLVEALPQNIFRKDTEGRVTFANRRYCEILNRTPAEIIGLTDFDLFPTELARKYQEDDRQVMEKGRVFETVEAHQTPEQGRIFVQVVKTPLYDAVGHLMGVQGMFWDVTEKKKIEEQLEYERELLRLLLDNVPDRIYFKDRESRFLRASLAMARRLGLGDPDEVIGKDDFDFHPEAEAREYYEDEQRIIGTGTPLINKVEKQVAPDGSLIWASVTKVPLRTRQGAVTGIIGISRDITALKHAEEELALARDAALETARLKSEFLAVMSHEIRTPMNGIIGMTNLLLQCNLSDEQRDFAETIRNSANALLDIINDILDFSKIEAGKLVLENIDFDLREVVESTVELLAERAHAKGLELASLVPENSTSRFRGDPGRLRQVLLNLLSNAVKFTETGEVLVEVVTESESDTSARLCIRVQDTGIGIPEATRNLVFEAFTQADGSTTRRYGGTGLGLAICRNLTNLMGGEIGLDSTPGKGSIFWIRIELDKQQGPAQENLQPNIDLTDVRVLIVDDNGTNRKILDRQTAFWKMRPVTAGGAAEALEILRESREASNPFQVILLDLQMPEIDGLTLARTLHQDSSLSGVPIILMTSLGSRFEDRLLRGAGVLECLLKPVRLSRLRLSLQHAIAPSAPHPDGSSAAHRDQISADSRPLRILLVEDNSVNLKVMQLQLVKLGYRADTAGNGSEARDAARQIPYDVILMDCHMPVMDGYEATRRIREHEAEREGGRVHIIAITANALDGDRDACLQAGMDDYITKPVELTALQSALERVHRRQAGPAESTPPPLNPAPPNPAPNPAEDGLPILDGKTLDTLQEMGNSDEAVVDELIQLWLTDTPMRIAELRKAVRHEQAAAVKTAAHNIKGSASNLGARRLAEEARSIEDQAAQQNLTGLGPRLEALEQAFAEVRQALADRQKEAPGPL